MYYDLNNDSDAEGGEATGRDVDIDGEGSGKTECSREELLGHGL